MRLGLPGPVASGLNTEQKDNSAVVEIDMSRELCEILAQNPSPSEMVGLSTKFLEDGQKDVALPLLRLALNKDPEQITALAVLGQALLHYGYLTEATEYLERAISKLLQNGHPTGVEDVNLLILSSVWAGVAYARQGKFDEGIIHLHRITKMKEPQDSNTKANYYEALVAFSSVLYEEGSKYEAINCLRKVVAYDESYRRFLEDWEKDVSEEGEFVRNLVNSRRADY